jgi:radical SAM-linked protein
MANPRVPEGPPPAPVVQKLRFRYAKRGRLRFASTRDFQRALERALRRAGVPMAYSAGFHPHPRISYANAASTGTASEAEYVEISLTRRMDPEVVRAALDAALPDGLDVVECVEAGSGALADRLQASDWTVRFAGLTTDLVAEAVAQFLEREQVDVSRLGKSGMRTFDVRGPVVSMTVTSGRSGDAGRGPRDESDTMSGDTSDADHTPDTGAQCAILRMVVRHTTPAVRPDDILTALRVVAGLEPPAPPLVTRLAQGPLHNATATVANPLATDENAAGA